MDIADIDPGAFDAEQLSIDLVIVVKQAAEMLIAGLEFMAPIFELWQFVGQLMGHEGHEQRSLAEMPQPWTIHFTPVFR
jgi:hypothetical protein